MNKFNELGGYILSIRLNLFFNYYKYSVCLVHPVLTQRIINSEFVIIAK